MCVCVAQSRGDSFMLKRKQLEKRGEAYSGTILINVPVGLIKQLCVPQCVGQGSSKTGSGGNGGLQSPLLPTHIK